MTDAPHVEEATEETGKVAVSKQSGPDTIPETIQELLWNPPLLAHENEEQFLKLFESFRAYAQPENIIDYHLVYNATVCKWETIRYRFMAMAVTANQQHAGLKSLFMQTHDNASIAFAERTISMEAAQNAKNRFRVDGIYPGRPSVFVVASGPRHHRALGCFGGKAICRGHQRT